jgi:hypothetical protein
MRTVNYNEVLQLVSELAGFTYSTLPADLALRLRGHISRRLREIWECDYWPELTRMEERRYRPVWTAGDTYTAGTEVFFRGNARADNGYYQALQAQPLSVSSLTRVSATAVCTTSANHGLITGDWVTVTGATQTDYNRNTEITYVSPTQFIYGVLNSPATPATGTIKVSPNPRDDAGNLCKAHWQPCASSYAGNTWQPSTFYTAGDIVLYAVTGRYYACHTANTGYLPTDTSHFGVLTPFDKYIAYEQSGQTALGEVRDVYSADPRVNRGFGTPNWTLSTNGLQVPDGPAIVWVEFRTRFTPLVGDYWASGTSYVVGNQVLYNSSGSVNNFYTCIQATSSVAPSNTSYWTIIEIPYLFQPYLVNGAYADFLKMDGQMDKAAAQDRMADEYLANELMKLHDQQPQYQRLSVRNAYPSSL